MKKFFLPIAILLILSIQVTGAGAQEGVKTAKEALSELGYSSVELRQNLRNEFEVKGLINGNKEITMILNFEWTSSIFDKEKMDELGIEYWETNQEFRLNNDEEESYAATIDSINIGSGIIKAIDIMVIEFEEFDFLEYTRAGGIIGRDFLIKYNAIFDISNQVLYLKTD
jgi:predicted aspartyl protease